MDAVDSTTFADITAHQEYSLPSEEDALFFMEDDMDHVKKGPWTDEEDSLLVNYVHVNGEGRWNSVARFAGLKRTGKSCRLRWLNYLRPDLRRGNITVEEQLMILELHSRWGNRWSKIAKCLPGRTDNEIKNYWRTRVQKQAKQLKCEVNSKEFRDTMRNVWIPQMAERIRNRSNPSGGPSPDDPTVTNPTGSDSNISETRVSLPDSDISTCYNLDHGFLDSKLAEQGLSSSVGNMSDMWFGGGETTSWESCCFWNEEDDACFLQQQLSDVDPTWWQNLLT